jgi:hypothetical protein
MKPTLDEKFVAWLALLSGLSISAVAVYYSVIGLTAIFAAAVIPIIIMGIVLELSKLVATVWLKQNWLRAPAVIKVYLTSAVIVLMFITSMGIFGFLSKAHLDQNVPTGDVTDKIAFIDEKIKTQRENIDAARKALKQMDESVDQVMARSTDERGAERAAQLRRQQSKERATLQQEISNAQRNITALNDERGPIAKDLRAIEAEVGPIKYIAAFIYGETDKNILEKAVTWVIMIIVVVFDPLAIVLLLAAQTSFQQFKKRDEEEKITKEDVPLESPPVIPRVEQVYLKRPWVDKVPGIDPVPHQVYKGNTSPITPNEQTTTTSTNVDPKIEPEDDIQKIVGLVKDIVENPTDAKVSGPKPLKELGGNRIVRTKVFPRVRPPELPTENITTTTQSVITTEEYIRQANSRREAEIKTYAELVRSKQIQMSDVPDEYLERIKSMV